MVEDELVDKAAALTYYALLAIFPAMIVVVAVLGVWLRSDRVADVLVGTAVDLLPASARDVGPVLRAALQARDQAGAFVIVGLVISVWAVSGFVAAFQRATSAIRAVPDPRPPWKLKLVRLPLTLLLLAILVLITLLLLATGPLSAVLERLVGLPDLIDRIWSVARWPVLLAVLNLYFVLLQLGSRPQRRRPAVQAWGSFGGLVGSTLWLAGSAGVSWYITHIAHGVSPYGALGTAVVFLGWVWLGSFSMLVGVEVDVRIVEPRRLTRTSPGHRPRSRHPG
ncbi:MAG TPA: YihY/virulence factor BrkB family protein [Pseudonocardiaceae bacterium]|nr:YihY/virulence factor BrkB family protein [Pseudonocardiaceae bacterium]